MRSRNAGYKNISGIMRTTSYKEYETNSLNQLSSNHLPRKIAFS